MKNWIFFAVCLLGSSFCKASSLEDPEFSMHPHPVIHKPAMQIIGISCRTSNEPDKASQDIPQLWGRFFQEGIQGRIPHKTSEEVVALYCDYEQDEGHPYTLVIGCPVDSIKEIPEGMVAKEIPASSFVVFPVQGEFPRSVLEAWQRIWATPLPRTYTGDYELYGEKFQTSQELDVYIAISSNSAI